MIRKILIFLSKSFHKINFCSALFLSYWILFSEHAFAENEPSFVIKIIFSIALFLAFNGIAIGVAYLIRGLNSYEFLPLTSKNIFYMLKSVVIEFTNILKRILSKVGFFRKDQADLNWFLFYIQIPLIYFLTYTVLLILEKRETGVEVFELDAMSTEYMIGILLFPLWLISLFFRNLEGWIALFCDIGILIGFLIFMGVLRLGILFYIGI